MIRLLVTAVVLALAQQAPTFRSSTHRVAVDVSVYSGNNPVAGLTGADFSLTDNGVPQKIEAVAVGEIPIDVTLVVDLSGSTAQQLEDYRRDVSVVASVLRPIDRFRLIAFQTGVREVMALTHSPVRVPIRQLESGRLSSVYDAIATALLRQPEFGRRHLVFVYTDALENRSILTGDQLLFLANSSEAVLHLVAPGVLPFIMESDKPCLLGYPIEAGSAPAPSCSGPPIIEQAVKATGGRLHVGAELAGPFRRVLRDYLNSYVLYFSPTGVPTAGWHDLSVKVTRPGRFTVNARQGYLARQ